MTNSRIIKPPFPSSELAAEHSHIVLEDVGITFFKTSTLQAVPFLADGEPEVSGPEMRRRALEKYADVGFVDLMRILAEQEDIPVELRPWDLVCTGTRMCDPDGSHSLAVLRWCKDESISPKNNEEKWRLRIYWLGCTWGSRYRLVRFK